MFGSQEFAQQRDSTPERYWMLLICLFQACRREEAGQLALKDIQEQDGIAFFNITDAEKDQHLKNEGSRKSGASRSVRTGAMAEPIARSARTRMIMRTRRWKSLQKWWENLVGRVGGEPTAR